MLQPARCRRLIRTQPISYPPDSGDDTRLPWRFYDGFASRVTGTRVVELKIMGESLQVWLAGHILLNRTKSPKSPARPYGSRRAPGGNMRRSMHPACCDHKPRVVSARRGIALPPPRPPRRD